MELAFITPTYKRCELLGKLYRTLVNQTTHEFVWIVINDGSPDDTDKYMKSIINSAPFEIRYLNKKNAGKASAVDDGLNLASDTDYAIIIDDDEELYSNAAETIIPYIEKYRNTDCGGMEFLRDDKQGTPIGNYTKDDFFMSIQMRKRKNLYIDGYTGYFIKKIGNLRSPHFKGEKYIGPGVLQCMVSNNSRLLWPNKSIGTTEYLEGGLTKQGRPLRLKNPKGMIYYSVLMQHPDSGMFLRFAYSVLGYAYFIYAGLIVEELTSENIDFYKLKKFACVPGFFLSMYWKLKYKNSL